jgi:MFS family permease
LSKKSLVFGTILLGLLTLISFVFNDFSILINIGFGIGITTILLAGMATGMGVVANFHIPIIGFEKVRKSNISILILLFGLPCLIGAILAYWLLNERVRFCNSSRNAFYNVSVPLDTKNNKIR